MRRQESKEERIRKRVEGDIGTGDVQEWKGMKNQTPVNDQSDSRRRRESTPRAWLGYAMECV